MLISAWVQLRSVDAVLGEIAAEFGVEDVLRPVFRERMQSTYERLRTSKEHLLLLGIDVVLREPLDEELQEMREWLKATS
jgi:hypothetical protein